MTVAVPNCRAAKSSRVGFRNDGARHSARSGEDYSSHVISRVESVPALEVCVVFGLALLAGSSA